MPAEEVGAADPLVTGPLLPLALNRPLPLPLPCASAALTESAKRRTGTRRPARTSARVTGEVDTMRLLSAFSGRLGSGRSRFCLSVHIISVQLDSLAEAFRGLVGLFA